jgi:hypothetical protein
MLRPDVASGVALGVAGLGGRPSCHSRSAGCGCVVGVLTSPLLPLSRTGRRMSKEWGAGVVGRRRRGSGRPVGWLRVGVGRRAGCVGGGGPVRPVWGVGGVELLARPLHPSRSLVRPASLPLLLPSPHPPSLPSLSPSRGGWSCRRQAHPPGLAKPPAPRKGVGPRRGPLSLPGYSVVYFLHGIPINSPHIQGNRRFPEYPPQEPT